MKPIFQSEKSKPAGQEASRRITPAKAMSCALMNQLATPGLGTLMAGRLISGAIQLTLAIAGFGALLVWFVLFMRFYYGALIDGSATEFHQHWIGKAAGIIFASSWLLALVSSISMVTKARRASPEPPPLQ